jgi:hypothetical protein
MAEKACSDIDTPNPNTGQALILSKKDECYAA